MTVDRQRPDVLHLAHRVPYPPDKGDRIRTFRILRWLAPRARVHLACLADEPVAKETVSVLRGLCARVAVVPLGKGRWVRALSTLASGRTVTEGAFTSPGLRAVLAEWARATPFHAVLTSASSLAPYLQMPELRDVPAVVDFMDVDSQKWFDYAAASRGPRAWLYRTEGRRLRKLEIETADRARAIMLVSTAEAQLFRQFCTSGTVEVIPNGVDLDSFRPTDELECDTCVFVGALDYRPNVDGVCWFCREVWPAIHQRSPQAKLSLVGRRPAPAVSRLAEVPGVEVVGAVPDVRPYLARAVVAVVPLQIARGIQNKVLEALAAGKATVASPPALAALHTQPGVHLLAAGAPAEWIEAILRLFADAGLRKQLGAAGRRYVAEHHRWERCLEPLAGLLGFDSEESPAVLDRTGITEAP
jgi:sugar transferase (PEP-CTERM/EpsH1 system associated)